MRFNNDEEAVSPVIGVILMVAITVILAAVIAVFVFGMASDIQTTKSVAATAKQSGTDILVTYQGGPDASKVTKISVIPYNSDGDVNLGKQVNGTEIIQSTIIANGTWWNNPEPGYSMTIAGAGTSAQERVVVTAVFDDGATQVLLDKQL